MDRLRIGLLINELNSDYTDMVALACGNWAKASDVNLIVFAAESFRASTGYRYQNEVLRSFLRPDVIDALVIATGTQCMDASPGEFKTAVVDALAPLPVVSLGIRLEGVPSVLIDGAAGIKSMVDHLARVHGRRDIAFLSGPLSNPEAMERLQAFKDGMAENGLEFREDWIIPGGFDAYTASIAWDEWFATHDSLGFDTLVCANDVTAIFTQEYLAKKGFQLPDQLVITGFDDIRQAEYQLPPLTSVRQPLDEASARAMESAVALVQGRPVPTVTRFPAIPVIRSSCGCLPPAVNLLRHGMAGCVDHENPGGQGAGKQSLANKITCLLHPDTDPLESDDDDPGRDVLLDLLESIPHSPRSGVTEASDRFLRQLNRMLDRDIRNGRGMESWQTILTLAQECLKTTGSGSRIPDPVHDALDQARAMIGGMAQIQFGRDKDNIRHQLRNLRHNMERLLSVVEIDDLIGGIRYELSDMGIRSCYLVRYEPVKIHQQTDTWELPGSASLLLAYQDGENLSGYSPFRQFNPREAMVPGEFLPRDRRWTAILSVLYFRNEQLGYMLFEAGTLDPFVYQTLTVLLANTINVCLLFNARQNAEERLRQVLTELEGYNQKLSRISQTDELTGLYNRRGFLDLARQQIRMVQRMDKRGLMVYADLDGLKKINDTWGHAAGDLMIQAGARVLQKTFRDMDVIGRMGGDEFAVFAANAGMDLETRILSRLEEYCAEFNSQSGLEYRLSMSMGMAEVSPSDGRGMESWLEEADSCLYERKREKYRRQGMNKGPDVSQA